MSESTRVIIFGIADVIVAMKRMCDKAICKMVALKAAVVSNGKIYLGSASGGLPLWNGRIARNKLTAGNVYAIVALLFIAPQNPYKEHQNEAKKLPAPNAANGFGGMCPIRTFPKSKIVQCRKTIPVVTPACIMINRMECGGL